MKTLEQQLTKESLQSLAGEITYARGEDYFHSAAVDDLRVFNNNIIACVAGSGFNEYDVALKAGKKFLDYQCSCPMGEDGDCCKHVVAAGLSWLKQGGKAGTGRRTGPIEDDARIIHEYLLMQPKETLAEWLLEQCVHNADLLEALRKQATKILKASRKKPSKTQPARRVKAVRRTKKTVNRR